MAWIYVLIMIFSVIALAVMLAALRRDSAYRRFEESRPRAEEAARRRKREYEEYEEASPRRAADARTRRSAPAFAEEPSVYSVMPEETGRRAKRRSFWMLKILCALVWLAAGAAFAVYFFL